MTCGGGHQAGDADQACLLRWEKSPGRHAPDSHRSENGQQRARRRGVAASELGALDLHGEAATARRHAQACQLSAGRHLEWFPALPAITIAPFKA